MPVLDKKLQKYLFCLYIFSLSVLQHIVEQLGFVVKKEQLLLCLKYCNTELELNWGVKADKSRVQHSDMFAG